MKKIATLFLILALTGCVSRADADKNLARGCSAAAELFMDEYFKIKTLKSVKFKPSSEFGAGYRVVMLFAVVSDGWLDIDKEYECVFTEEMGAMNASHRANLYQIKAEGKTYGMNKATPLQKKLNETVQRAMGQ